MVEGDDTITTIVDLNRLPLRYIREDRGSVLIGATTTIREIEFSPLFRKAPLDILYDAVRDFGTVQVRNMASLGGNLCNGVPSADTPPSLIALDAVIMITGRRGRRSIPLEKLYRHVRKLSIRRGEILTEVRIPRQLPNTFGTYLRLTRSHVDISVVSAAVRITVDKDRGIEDCRIVLGAVAPTPLRSIRAENYLRGKTIDSVSFTEAGQIASRETRPITDIRASADYRRSMAAVLVERAIRTAISKSGKRILVEEDSN